MSFSDPVPSKIGLSRDQSAAVRPTRWSALASWASGLLAVGVAWVEHSWQVLHPHYLPLLLPLATMIVAAALAVATGSWRVVAGPSRRVAVAWLLSALVPLVFWAGVGLYARTQWHRRWVPNNLPMNLATMLGLSLMRLETSVEYPYSLETERLVMFYDRLNDPRADAEAMERHICRLEALVGRPLRAKIYWVRGPLRKLGLSRLSTHALSLGSQESATDWNTDGGLDRHEIAHAVLDELRARQADPPTLLHEGWATAQSGERPETLARNALAYREAEPAVRLRGLVAPDHYYRDAGPVYPVGGAFVAFLIRRHGIERFLKLYNEGKPETFGTVCRRVYGIDLDALEESFWDDARQLASRRASAQ